MPAKKKTETEEKPEEMSKEEQTGFHKGALQTLVGERNELIKLVQITEGFMQAHIQSLEKLGVKLPVQEQPDQKADDKSINLEDNLA
tara:strand:+ start:194 stop:454 length:261 start_codon:yes stop_codon:yes gene_type:complete